MFKLDLVVLVLPIRVVQLELVFVEPVEPPHTLDLVTYPQEVAVVWEIMEVLQEVIHQTVEHLVDLVVEEVPSDQVVVVVMILL